MSRRDCLQAARLFRAELLAVLVAALLSACGGGQDSPSDAAAMPPLQQTLLENQACSPQAILEGMAQPIGQDCVRSLPLLRTQARPRALAVTTASASAAVSASSLTPDMLMDWAERQYPELFAPAASPTQSASPYLYRHYASTGNYLAVAGTEIYVLGPVSGGQLSRVGTLADFSCVVATFALERRARGLQVGIVGPVDDKTSATYTFLYQGDFDARIVMAVDVAPAFLPLRRPIAPPEGGARQRDFEALGEARLARPVPARNDGE